MRIRCIKPEFWYDEQCAAWPPMARLAYIGLWNEADDQGRLRANAAYLKAHLFPYDAAIDMDEVLRPIIQAGKLRLYTVEGQTFGHLRNFNAHQVINRPSASKLPEPPFATDSAIPHGALTEHSRKTHAGKEGKGTGKGMESGKGRQSRKRERWQIDKELVSVKAQKAGLWEKLRADAKKHGCCTDTEIDEGARTHGAPADVKLYDELKARVAELQQELATV
jgi:hypothetical protein